MQFKTANKINGFKHISHGMAVIRFKMCKHSRRQHRDFASQSQRRLTHSMSRVNHILIQMEMQTAPRLHQMLNDAE
jgi:hypothetical protein